MAKSKVMDRPMFKGMMPDEPVMDVENVGIMQGFQDILGDEGEDYDEDEYETGAMMGRTPDSPEILMNNLRGDMRSVDARREELADLVGTAAAMETPDSVLAMLQPVLAQQGIGSLPPPPAAMPGAMPPAMPPAPMPAAQGPMPPPPGMPPGGIAGMPPLQMAKGGIVQRFSEGTPGPDEDQDGGVSPAVDTSPSILNLMSPDLRRRAEEAFIASLGTGRSTLPDLGTSAKKYAEEYKKILGEDTRSTEAQMLLELAQRAFAYAANVDEQGKPLRGSQVARFAGAVRTLPGALAKYESELSKDARALKLLGIQTAEKEREALRKTQAEGQKNLASLYKEAIKKDASAGKVSGSAFNQYQELIIPFVEGTSSQAQDIRLLNAVTELTKPTVVSTTDKMGNVSTRTTRADIPQSFVDGYIAKYGKEAFDAWYKSIDPKQELKISPIAFPRTTSRSPVVEPSGAAVVSPVAPPGAGTTVSPIQQETGIAEVKTPAGAQQVAALSSLPADDPGRPVLWTVRSYLAGPINTAEAFIARNVPGMPPNLVDKVRKDAIKANEALIEALSTNDGRISVDEMTRLRPLIGLTPRVFGGEGAMSTALVSVDDALIKEKEILTKVVQNPDQYLGRNVADARMKINLIDTYRKGLGVPQSVFTEKEFQALPVYTEFVDKRNAQDFRIARKDTFSWRNEPAIREFQKNNPGKQYAVILPNNRGVKIFTAPGKTQ